MRDGGAREHSDDHGSKHAEVTDPRDIPSMLGSTAIRCATVAAVLCVAFAQIPAPVPGLCTMGGGVGDSVGCGIDASKIDAFSLTVIERLPCILPRLFTPPRFVGAASSSVNRPQHRDSCGSFK